MLHFLCSMVHLLCMKPQLFCQIEFPKAMQANDEGGFLPAIIGQLKIPIHPSPPFQLPEGQSQGNRWAFRYRPFFPHRLQHILFHAAKAKLKDSKKTKTDSSPRSE